MDSTTIDLSGEITLRLVAALVLGALVGAEREATDQPAGLRTHIAVCLGAALFGVVSTLGFTEFQAERATTNFQVDVTRVASQVVVGIGFLGAGMIFRQGTAVRNLTTAASLWVVAAIGLAAGVGDVGTAALTTVVLLVSLVVLRPLRTLLRRRTPGEKCTVRARLLDDGDPDSIVRELESTGLRVKVVAIEKEEGKRVVVASLDAPPEDLLRAQTLLTARPDIDDLRVLEASGKASVAAESAES
jgi:putative Mg2+ transporter-C (MgtC) family protein